MGFVPVTAMVCVSSECGDLIGESALRDSWEYNGVVVPGSTERWASHILHTALDILVRKHLGGSEVGFVGYKIAGGSQGFVGLDGGVWRRIRCILV